MRLSLCELQGLLGLHHVGLLLLEEGSLPGEQVGPEGLTGLGVEGARVRREEGLENVKVGGTEVVKGNRGWKEVG